MGWLVGITLIFFAIMPVQAGENRESIDKALRLSGISAQFDELGLSLISTMPFDAFPNQKFRLEAIAMIKKCFTPAGIRESMIAAMSRELDLETLDAVIKFYESKLGRKAARINETALEGATLRNIRESRTYFNNLDANRVELLKRLLIVENSAADNERLMRSVLRGFIEVSTKSKSESDNLEQVTEKFNIVNNIVAARKSGIEDTALMASAYSLRLIDDKELRELIAFLETEPAARFNAAIMTGLDETVQRLAKNIAEAMVKWRQECAPDQ